MPDRSRCPNCGERVSPYAAGCAVCGADIDHRRWDSGPSALNRVGSWLSALSFGRERPGIGLGVLVLIFFGGSFLAWLAGLFG
jgi:predicted amidophosphoribosyltransferase